jgi:hypothetical protein
MAHGSPELASYHALFLTQEDLPSLRMIQDHRDDDTNRGEIFERHHGRANGMVLWEGDYADAICALYDWRWAFPDDASAAAYHQASLSQNSGGGWIMPLGVKHVGEECAAFGNTVELGITMPPLKMTVYVYQFRVGNVVALLNVTQGLEAPDGTLTLAAVASLATVAAERIQAIAG